MLDLENLSYLYHHPFTYKKINASKTPRTCCLTAVLVTVVQIITCNMKYAITTHRSVNMLSQINTGLTKKVTYALSGAHYFDHQIGVEVASMRGP